MGLQPVGILKCSGHIGGPLITFQHFALTLQNPKHKSINHRPLTAVAVG